LSEGSKPRESPSFFWQDSRCPLEKERITVNVFERKEGEGIRCPALVLFLAERGHTEVKVVVRNRLAWIACDESDDDVR
jgi:hypothetical protein